MLMKNTFYVIAFPHCSKLNFFLPNVKHYVFVDISFGCIGMSKLITNTFRGSLYLIDFPCHVQINVIYHNSFQRRHVMKQFTLGPLAFKYSKNIIVYTSLNVLFEGEAPLQLS